MVSWPTVGLRVCRKDDGTPGGTRTPDARLRTPPLYPLSYRGLVQHCQPKVMETGQVSQPGKASTDRALRLVCGLPHRHRVDLVLGN